MKKLFLSFTVLLFAIQFCNAQTAQGNQTLGIDLGYIYIDNTNYQISPYNNTSAYVHNKVTNFNIGPSYSFFLDKNLDLGASLSYESDLTKNDDVNQPTRQHTRYYGASLF